MKLLNRFLLLIIPIVISCKSTVVESSNHKQTQTKALTVSVKLEIEKPNFIFYLADDQDQLDYGCYGNPKVSTPNVDLLAKEGMLFNNFYTGQAICAPARSQIYTGMYPVKNA
jgi:hypothetical protein